jgi:hypothetical protein
MPTKTRSTTRKKQSKKKVRPRKLLPLSKKQKPALVVPESDEASLFTKHRALVAADKRPKQPDALTLAASRRTKDGKYIVDDFGFGEDPDGKHYVTFTSEIVCWKDTYGFAGNIEVGGQRAVGICFPGMNMEEFLNLIDKTNAVAIKPIDEVEE